MEVKTAGETLKAVWPEMEPDAAVMVVLPSERDVARPRLETVATAVFEEDQRAVEDRFCVLPSE